MKIQTAKHLLHSATSRMIACLTEKALGHIGIRTDDHDTVTFAASDWMLSTYHRVDCEILEKGECFLPLKLFADVVRESPDGTIQLELTDSAVVVTAGASREFYFRLPLVSDVGWAVPFALENENRMEFDSVALSYMIEQVIASIDTDSVRSYGSVGYFHKPRPETLRLVGSNSYKFSYCETDIGDGEQRFPDNICLPKRGLVELMRMCGDGNEKVAIYVIRDNTVLAVETQNRQMFIRLSAVRFPRYDEVLPTEGMLLTSVVERVALQTAVRRMLLATGKKNTLRMCFGNGKLTMRARDGGNSECQEVLTVENTLDTDYELDINGRYVLDILATVVGDRVVVGFKDREHPFMIVPEVEMLGCRSKHVIPPIMEEH